MGQQKRGGLLHLQTTPAALAADSIVQPISASSGMCSVSWEGKKKRALPKNPGTGEKYNPHTKWWPTKMSVEGKLKIKLLLGRNESLALRSVTRLEYVIKIKFIKTNTHYMGFMFFSTHREL